VYLTIEHQIMGYSPPTDGEWLGSLPLEGTEEGLHNSAFLHGRYRLARARVEVGILFWMEL
jgi:hypothetical protein